MTYLKLAKLWMGSPKILVVKQFHVGWGRAKYENDFVILLNMHVGLCNVVAFMHLHCTSVFIEHYI
jgi:hypothetical protein